MEKQLTSQEILAMQARVGCTRIDVDSTEQATQTILDHFNVASLEDLVDKLDEYIHEEDLYEKAKDWYDLVSTDSVSEMASEMDSRFTDFMDNEVKHKLNHYILTEENLDELREMFHRVLSEHGLE